MPTLIKDGVIAVDTYVPVLPVDGVLTLPAGGDILVSLDTFTAHREQVLAHGGRKGVQLKPDQFAESLADVVASLDLIASVFSPIDWNEAARVLRTGGGVLRLGPARDHLLELREKLYDEVREYQDDKHLGDLPAGFSLAHSEQLSFRLPLDSRQAREDLLSMTPHGWRVNAERREQVLAEAFEVTVAVRYDWIVNTSTPAQD